MTAPDPRQTGAELIAAERQRQITDEGYVPGHDAHHNGDELARAAVAYATPWWQRGADHGEAARGWRPMPPVGWPWGESAWKPYTGPDSGDGYWTQESAAGRIRELVKAGALIAAEIDRLQAVVARG